MSLGDVSRYGQEALEELNAQAETIHSELQSAGAPDYPSTTVEMMTPQDRRDIGEYLTRESGHDFASSLYIIDRLGMIYREDEDRYIATESLFDPDVSSDEEELLAHEAGHRFGRKVVEEELNPLKGSEAVSGQAFEVLVGYLLSENFAERFKVATGETLDEDFSYDHSLVDDPRPSYKLRDRFGPDEMVDPGRDEDLEMLLAEVEGLVDDLSRGVQDWT